ncbi:MAG: hypothetical protein HDS71_03295 [Bacteroidales bacterium]|nr:hypothetical protein [Bacteroidales bacterium]
MKLELITLLMTLMCCSCDTGAQTINAFVEGAVWEMGGGSGWDPKIYIKENYYIEGKETINDIEYLKMYRSSSSEDSRTNEIKVSDKHYIGCVRNEAGKIFFIPRDYKEELLIFDFNLNPSDKVEIYPYAGSNKTLESESLTCVYTEEYIVGDSKVKLLYLSSDGGTEYYKLNEWISCIGTGAGPLKPIYADTGGIYTSVKRVTINGRVVYQWLPKSR